jgi:glutathione synthase/RimK-type ligase-like ATP-grasp enzyme
MKNYFYRIVKRKLGWWLKTSPLTKGAIQRRVHFRNEKNWDSIVKSIEAAQRVEIDKSDIRVGLVKDDDDLSFGLITYWPKFERFLRHNSIKYSFINIHAEDWVEAVSNYDLIVWRPFSDPASMYEQSTKISFIETYLNIRCHPSSSELWTYEDKVRVYFLLSFHKLPIIPTFISFDEQECLQKLDDLIFPLISKANVGSSSYSVKKLNSRASAKRYIRRAFSSGVSTGFPYYRQKGYVYFQEYVKDARYDLRIILIGNKIFGYYRMRPAHDFRASGAGLRKEGGQLPIDAVKLAMKVKEVMPSTMLAVDFLKSPGDETHRIIETSINTDIRHPQQLVRDGQAGYYTLDDEQLIFHPGEYWLQELILEEVITGMVKERQHRSL